jgi:hypothetical protein
MILSSYVLRGGADIWDGMIARCKEFEADGQVVSGVDCVGRAVAYLIGAAASYGAGQAGVEYIANGGITTTGKRDLAWHSSSRHQNWNWTAIHSNPKGIEDIIGAGLPGSIVHSVYNHTDCNLSNSITIYKESNGTVFTHSSNVTHGVVSRSTIPAGVDITKRDYSWDFSGWGGMKYSYSSPGCQDYFTNTEIGDLEWETWNFASWANSDYYNKAWMYELDWTGTYYGIPYVGGYLVLETNGFGLDFEGAPDIGGCSN